MEEQAAARLSYSLPGTDGPGGYCDRGQGKGLRHRRLSARSNKGITVHMLRVIRTDGCGRGDPCGYRLLAIGGLPAGGWLCPEIAGGRRIVAMAGDGIMTAMRLHSRMSALRWERAAIFAWM